MGRPKVRTEQDIKNTQNKCRITHRAKRWKIVLEALEYESCYLCGEEDILVLEFDHINEHKKWDISTMICRGLGTQQDLIDEIQKCKIICRNCHVKRHHKERNTLKWQYVNKDLYERHHTQSL